MKSPVSPSLRRKLAPEDLFARYCRLKAQVLAMADACERPLRQVEAILSSAGFVVRVIVKHDYHHLWGIRMKVGVFDLSPDLKLAGRQIRRLLVLGGSRTDTVMVRRTKARYTCESSSAVPSACRGW
jgi:hypothetical protein